MTPTETKDHESQYTEQWQSKLYSLRLIGRLHELRAQDPKPIHGEDDTAPLRGPIDRKTIIIRRRDIK